MSFVDDLRAALVSEFASDRLVFFKDWRKNRTGAWKGPKGKPVALFLHHTAAAATESTDPRAKGNQTGANSGVVNFIQTHYKVPAANFTIDRDGTLYVHSGQAIWHAGLGSFKGKPPWNDLGIPDNDANRWCLGVEIMSKGKRKDFTRAQKQAVAALIRACANAGGWKPLWLKNRPRHKDWTTRKIDILYSNDEVKSWLE